MATALKLIPWHHNLLAVTTMVCLLTPTALCNQTKGSCSIGEMDLSPCFRPSSSSFSIDESCCKVLNRAVKSGFNCLCLLLGSSSPSLSASALSLPLSNCLIEVPSLTHCRGIRSTTSIPPSPSLIRTLKLADHHDFSYIHVMPDVVPFLANNRSSEEAPDHQLPFPPDHSNRPFFLPPSPPPPPDDDDDDDDDDDGRTNSSRGTEPPSAEPSVDVSNRLKTAASEAGLINMSLQQMLLLSLAFQAYYLCW